jgi:hypothetical protein
MFYTKEVAILVGRGEKGEKRWQLCKGKRRQLHLWWELRGGIEVAGRWREVRATLGGI